MQNAFGLNNKKTANNYFMIIIFLCLMNLKVYFYSNLDIIIVYIPFMIPLMFYIIYWKMRNDIFCRLLGHKLVFEKWTYFGDFVKIINGRTIRWMRDSTLTERSKHGPC